MTPEQRARQLASLAALRADPEFEAKRLAALSRPEVREKIAAAVSMKLVELWACEESDWPAIIGVIR
jgi:hypothetical protein